MIVERYKALGNKAATISPGDLPQDLRSRRTDGGARALPSSLRNETKSSRIFRNNVGRRRGNWIRPTRAGTFRERRERLFERERERGRGDTSFALGFNFDLCDRRGVPLATSSHDISVTDRDERQLAKTYIGKSRSVIYGLVRAKRRSKISVRVIF